MDTYILLNQQQAAGFTPLNVNSIPFNYTGTILLFLCFYLTHSKSGKVYTNTGQYLRANKIFWVGKVIFPSGNLSMTKGFLESEMSK